MMRLAAVMLGACLVGGCVSTRPPAQSWAELMPRVRPGTPVAVTDATGLETRGRVSALTLSSLTMRSGGAERQFDAPSVRYVRRDGDPLWNGLAIGAGLGVLGAAMTDTTCSSASSACNETAGRVGIVAVWSAIGAGIDALVRDQSPLYVAIDRPTVRIVPQVTPHRVTLTVAIDVPASRR